MPLYFYQIQDFHYHKPLDTQSCWTSSSRCKPPGSVLMKNGRVLYITKWDIKEDKLNLMSGPLYNYFEARDKLNDLSSYPCSWINNKKDIIRLATVNDIQQDRYIAYKKYAETYPKLFKFNICPSGKFYIYTYDTNTATTNDSKLLSSYEDFECTDFMVRTFCKEVTANKLFLKHELTEYFEIYYSDVSM